MLLVGQDSVYEREPGHEGKERKRGHWGGDAFKRLSIAHHRLPFPGKASQPPIAVCGTSGPDILSGCMETRRGANHCCFNRCIAIFPHFYSPLILYLRPSHPSGRTFHLNISSFLLFLSELSLLFLLYDKIKVREWDNFSLASKAVLEISTR